MLYYFICIFTSNFCTYTMPPGVTAVTFYPFIMVFLIITCYTSINTVTIIKCIYFFYILSFPWHHCISSERIKWKDLTCVQFFLHQIHRQLLFCVFLMAVSTLNHKINDSSSTILLNNLTMSTQHYRITQSFRDKKSCCCCCLLFRHGYIPLDFPELFFKTSFLATSEEKSVVFFNLKFFCIHSFPKDYTQ